VPLPQEAIAEYGLVPFFNHDLAPTPEPEFVCWLDLMGMQNAMLRSLPKTANFAMKLLVAAAPPQTPHPQTLGVCPVIDGLFIHSPDRDELLGVVKRAIARLAMACISGGQPEHTFLIRGAMAFGPLVKGTLVNDECFRPDTYHGSAPQRPPLADRVIFGFAVSAAYRASHKAPPFGVLLDDSATKSGIGAEGIAGDGPLWHWWEHSETECDLPLARELKSCVNAYFDWCSKRPLETGYEPHRLREHRELFEEYYLGVD